MCVAPIGKVLEINNGKGLCDFEGVKKEVTLMLLPQAKIGDYVVVHAGYAVQIVKDYKKLLQEMVTRNVQGERLLALIAEENAKFGHQELKIMNFCGTHEYSIVKYGLREILADNIRLIAGPGCPVCVVPEEEIMTAWALLEKEDVILTTYGDMYRVPTAKGALKDAKALGYDVRVVYGVDEAVKLARSTDKQVVHLAIGFETTAPTTASALLEAADLKNFSLLSSHRFSAPVMEYVLTNNQLDAVLCPGHVAAIIGEQPFEAVVKKYNLPGVISGFEPLDVLESILMILKQKNSGDIKLENQYERVVEDKGNTVAREAMDKVFKPEDAVWRGFPCLPASRMVLRDEYAEFDAVKKFNLQDKIEVKKKTACLCGKVLQGRHPSECSLFNHKCNPENPAGPCMVSQEGPCFIAFQYQ